jgi:hypothetical protein
MSSLIFICYFAENSPIEKPFDSFNVLTAHELQG